MGAVTLSGVELYKGIVERDIEQKLKQGVNSMGRGKQHITEELEEQILENLKEKGKGTVKEISTSIGQGYHATYQRLTEMVKRGDLMVYRDGKLNIYKLGGGPAPGPKKQLITPDMVLPTPPEMESTPITEHIKQRIESLSIEQANIGIRIDELANMLKTIEEE